MTETLDCGHPPSPHSPMTTGYGRDADGKRHCYDCCAERERKAMIDTGRATLYLARNADGNRITDWPGKLSFVPRHVSKGRHNIARTRYDAWFVGPDNFIWHGVQYGDWTQIIHCRRTRHAA